MPHGDPTTTSARAPGDGHAERCGRQAPTRLPFRLGPGRSPGASLAQDLSPGGPASTPEAPTSLPPPPVQWLCPRVRLPRPPPSPPISLADFRVVSHLAFHPASRHSRPGRWTHVTNELWQTRTARLAPTAPPPRDTVSLASAPTTQSPSPPPQVGTAHTLTRARSSYTRRFYYSLSSTRVRLFLGASLYPQH